MVPGWAAWRDPAGRLVFGLPFLAVFVLLYYFRYRPHTRAAGFLDG
jgi:hypothetical protein